MTVQVGEAAAIARIENGVAVDCERTVAVDAETRCSWTLDRVVELKLEILYNLPSASILVQKLAIVQGNDGDRLTVHDPLAWDVLTGDFEGCDLEFA